MRPRILKTIARIILVALAYLITGWLGLLLPAVGSHITLLWLPTGIAVGSLLRWGFGCWPGVTLGAFAVNVATGLPWSVALAIAVGNTLGPLLAAWALRRIGIHPAFDRKRDILLLAAAGALGTLVSSTLGATTLALAALLPGGRVTAWLIWWGGDTLGVIAAAPLVLAFTRLELRSILLRRGEFLIWLGVSFLAVWGVFILNRGTNGHPWALSFVPLPLVAWAALRFGSTGTSLALIILSAGAAYGTATGRGPFFRTAPVEGVVVLWAFMATSAVLGWLITALHFARVRATGFQSLFEGALSDASLGVLLTGLDRRVTYASAGFTRLTGYTEAELLGKSCAILQGPGTDPATVAKLIAAVQNGGHFDGEILNYRKDGTPFWNALVISPMRDESCERTGFLGVLRDITPRKEAETALLDLNRKMQETQKLESLGVLAGGIAHDFNNILTAILGNASLAINDVPPGSPVHECLDQINQAAMRAAELCRQMLAYSGRGRFVVRRLDLGELIAETAQMLQISISKKSVLRFHPGADLPPVEVDPTQLRQVIMNLVINASDAIGDKGGVINVSTGLAHVDRAYLDGAMMAPDLPEGDYVVLEVSDNGCGMTPEIQAKIFDPFFTTKFTGRGLGLAAVLGIVRGHKGALKVYSEPGRGSTFKLLFPAAAGAIEAAVETPACSSDWHGHGTVLVVDDEPSVRGTVLQMLAATGLEAVVATDGREGVEIFRADPAQFALVLLDLTMPHMDGAEAFAELRKSRADIPVVLMSGFSEQEALVRFAGKGIASFIQKPFALDSLRRVIRGVLG